MKKLFFLAFYTFCFAQNSNLQGLKVYTGLIESLSPYDINLLIVSTILPNLSIKFSNNASIAHLKQINGELNKYFSADGDFNVLKPNLINFAKTKLCKDSIFIKLFDKNMQFIWHFSHKNHDKFNNYYG